MSELCFENLSTCCIILIVCFFMLHTCIGWSCFKVKRPLARSKDDIQNLNGYSEFQIHIHLIQKTNFNHLAKLIKQKDCFVKIYMYDVFFKVLKSNHVAVASVLDF